LTPSALITSRPFFTLTLFLMANLSQTAASVVASALSTKLSQYTYGATVVAGNAVFLNTSNQWVLADANPTGSGQAVTDTVGVALNGGASGQPACVAVLDTTGLNLGATLTVGQTYCVSGTAGAIAPISDLTTGDFPIILGVASTAALLILRPVAGGAAKP